MDNALSVSIVSRREIAFEHLDRFVVDHDHRRCRQREALHRVTRRQRRCVTTPEPVVAIIS